MATQASSVGLAIQPDGKAVGVGGGTSDNFEMIQILSGTNQHTFYTYDANYNVTAALDRDGNVVERYTYTPYGQRTVIDDDWSSDGNGLSDISSNFGHQGGMIDVESGLMKFRNRDLHLSLGNWIERDPLGCVDGMNLYGNRVNNPVNSLDPLGTKVTDTFNATYHMDEGEIRVKIEGIAEEGQRITPSRYKPWKLYGAMNATFYPNPLPRQNRCLSRNLRFVQVAYGFDNTTPSFAPGMPSAFATDANRFVDVLYQKGYFNSWLKGPYYQGTLDGRTPAWQSGNAFTGQPAWMYDAPGREYDSEIDWRNDNWIKSFETCIRDVSSGTFYGCFTYYVHAVNGTVLVGDYGGSRTHAKPPSSYFLEALARFEFLTMFSPFGI